jgi:hypothetical protein
MSPFLKFIFVTIDILPTARTLNDTPKNSLFFPSSDLTIMNNFLSKLSSGHCGYWLWERLSSRDSILPKWGLSRLESRSHQALNSIRFLDSRLRDCVATLKNHKYLRIVIPGLTRNPAFFQRITQLDAGSSPA